ncbi:MAG: class I SAM-dependent methyltransferase [Leptolyngbyaceae cyanobacterium]
MRLTYSKGLQDFSAPLSACAKATPGFDWVEQVKITQLEPTGLTLEVSNSTTVQPLRLDFPAPAEGMLSLKQIVGAIIMESRAKLGWDQENTVATSKMGHFSAHLYDYLLSVSLREPKPLTQLRQATAQLPVDNMQIAPDQGQFMALLIKLMGAKKVLEIGTFTGYSALWMALALPPDGTLITCDIETRCQEFAPRYWQAAGVANKIDLRIAPALDTLDKLLTTGAANTFDFAFIDADKINYRHYYEKCLTLLRPGGLMAIDNVLWGGAVANPRETDPDTVALRELNQTLHQDQRIELSMLAIADGLTLAFKRP